MVCTVSAIGFGIVAASELDWQRTEAISSSVGIVAFGAFGAGTIAILSVAYEHIRRTPRLEIFEWSYLPRSDPGERQIQLRVRNTGMNAAVRVRVQFGPFHWGSSASGFDVADRLSAIRIEPAPLWKQQEHEYGLGDLSLDGGLVGGQASEACIIRVPKSYGISLTATCENGYPGRFDADPVPSEEAV